MFNEFCLIGCVYHLQFFTDFVTEATINYNAGWSIIMITMINIVINMLIMIYSSVKLVAALCRRMKQKLDANNKTKKYQETPQAAQTLGGTH